MGKTQMGKDTNISGARRGNTMEREKSSAGAVNGGRRPSPELCASLLSIITWHWISSFVSSGNRNSLLESQLYDLNPRETTHYCEQQWKTWLNLEKTRAGTISVLKVLSRCVWKEMAIAAVFKSLWIIPLIAQVFILKALVMVVDDSKHANHSLQPFRASVLVLGMLFSSLFQSFSIHMCYMRSQKAGMKLRATVATAIFNKVLKLTTATIMESSSNGELMNLITNDTQKLLDAASYFHFVLFSALEATIVAGLSIFEAGVSAIPGVFTVMLTMPLSVWMALAVRHIRKNSIQITDKRVRLLGEMLVGIKVLKFNGWTTPFFNIVKDLRDLELHWIRKAAFFRASTSVIRDATTPVASLLTFGTYVVLHDGHIQAGSVFTILVLFSYLSRIFSYAPIGMQYAAEALVAVKRLQRLLNLPEVRRDNRDNLNYKVRDREDGSDGCVVLENCTMSWKSMECFESSNTADLEIKESEISTKENEEGSKADIKILQKINIFVKRGEIIAIVGPSGSGKTSLILGILGELELLEGSCHVRSRLISYVPQLPWIVNGTICNNIVFGNTYNQHLYTDVVKACALDLDIFRFPAGHDTEIGERGINLSGGQKARISLARACYHVFDRKDESLVLLDDPFAAVDATTAKHLMHNVLCGILKETTIILVTHNVEAMKFCDHIYEMRTGKVHHVSEKGCYIQNILDKRNVMAMKREGEPLTSQSLTGDLEGHEGQFDQLESIGSVYKTGDELKSESEQKISYVKKSSFHESEEQRAGMVEISTYVQYITKGSTLLFLVVMAFFLFTQAVRTFLDYWLGVWTDEKYSLKAKDYFIAYASLVMATTILYLARVLLFTVAAILSAVAMHNNMASSVFSSPQLFFDQNPAGRILNRFSKDQALVDDLLPNTAQQMSESVMACLGSIAIAAVIIPWSLLALVPFFLVYFYYQQRYLAIARQLKRLEGVSRSPIYTTFAETLQGLTSVRAYVAESAVHGKFLEAVDANHRAYIMSVHTSRWLGMRLDFVTTLWVTMAALMVIFLRKSLSPGFAGVLLVQSLQLTASLQFAVRFAADTQICFTSVERIHAYSNLESESDHILPLQKISMDWPQEGKIEFINYTMSYRVDLPPVLNNISFKVNAREKIGIIGRTGSGKSSLVAALFRIVENKACHGCILVDDVDINSIRLDDLRKRLSMVPQDPILFRGTIRFNLDPFDQYTDREIQEALGRVHFVETTDCLEVGLDSRVVENGDNFSVGQRQLLCIARCLLRRTRIVVMDEATASVDVKTERLIQASIREVFGGCTVLKIAHRLETITDADRVILVEEGHTKWRQN